MIRAACAAICVALIAAAATHGADLVEITGGADETGQNYAWTVKNKGPTPITRIIFPHYKCDSFTVPSGWKRGETTNLARANQKDAPGICEALAEAAGLPTGASAQFEMRLSRASADRRPGTVSVYFADGSRAQISGVELPTAKGFVERNISPIVLGVIFITFLMLQRRRRRAARAANASAEPLASPPEGG